MTDFDEVDDFFGNDDLMDDAVDDDQDKVPTDAEVLNNLFEDGKQGKTKRRIVQRPQPKFNESSLTSEKGIPALRKMFKDFKPRKDLDPYGNLSIIMKKYEHWGHLIFPKMKFEDVITRCETLGNRRMVRVYMMKSRLDMPLTDEDFAPTSTKTDADEIIVTESAEDEAAPTVQGIITSREEDDEENYYDPFQNEPEPDYSDFPDF